MINLVEKFVHFLGWMRFVISPLLLFSIFGFVFYLKYKGNFGLIGGIIIAVIGLALGIFWAESIRRKEGTMEVLSRENGNDRRFWENVFSKGFKKKK
jgi:hypothetical protein